MSTTDRDYVLGTHDEELERLGLQHRVWRPRMVLEIIAEKVADRPEPTP